MKSIYKLLTILLVFALLISLLFLPKAHRKAENSQALYQQLSQCLSYYDRIYENMLWSLDYAQAYTKSPSWDSLSRARAACSAAKAAIAEEALPDNTASMNQYLELLQDNIDSDLVYTLWENIQEQNLPLLQMRTLESFVYEQVHFYEMTSRMENWTGDCRAYIQAHCTYLTLITNYLLLEMDMPSRWTELSQQAPTVFSFSQGWSADQEQITESYTQAQDAYSSFYVRMEDLDSIRGYSIRLESIAVIIAHKPSVSEVMAPYLWQIPGIPAYFPMPEWLESSLPGKADTLTTEADAVKEKFRFLNPAEETTSDSAEILEDPIISPWQYESADSTTQTTRQILAGDAIQDLPVLCRITVAHLPLTEVENYSHLLEEFGLAPQIRTNQERTEMTLEADSGTCHLQVLWTEAETSLLLTEAVGCLIQPAYLEAIMAQ